MGANGFKDQEQQGKQHHTYNYKAEAVIIIATGNRGLNADAMLANAFQGLPGTLSSEVGGYTTTARSTLIFPSLFSSRPFFSNLTHGLCVFCVSAS